jgi:GT2 family glycosyltransferase
VAFNDVDFCLKLLESGYRNVVLPYVRLKHHESKTRGPEDTPEKQKRFEREKGMMLEKWKEYLLNDPYYNPNLAQIGEYFNIKD